MYLIPSVVESFFFFLILTLFSPRAFCQYYWELLESTPLSFHGLLKEGKYMPPRDSYEEKPLSKKKPPLNWSLFMYNVIAIEYYFFLVVLPSIVSICFLALFPIILFFYFFFFLFRKCICENGEFSISKDNT